VEMYDVFSLSAADAPFAVKNNQPRTRTTRALGFIDDLLAEISTGADALTYTSERTRAKTFAVHCWVIFGRRVDLPRDFNLNP
jgi:hypothetical protein